MSLKKVISQIKASSNFLITSHVNPEADALGSELAFYKLIRALGKTGVIINEEVPGLGYEFLPGIGIVKKYKDNIRNIRFDCFVALDCSDLKRTGEVYKLNTAKKPVINIDHHVSNVKFGTINWVDGYTSSASEMVYELYKKFGVPLDKESAFLIYCGILTDTGSFRFSNTSPKTHRVVAELLEYGLDVVEIYKLTYGNLPFKDMELIAKLLNDIKRQNQGRVVWFEVKASVLKKYKNLYADLTDYLMNFARAIKGVEVAVIFKENLGVKGEVRVNFRSQGKVDVNKVAQSFGGGGHKSASGATLYGSLAEVKNKVLKKINSVLKEV